MPIVTTRPWVQWRPSPLITHPWVQYWAPPRSTCSWVKRWPPSMIHMLVGLATTNPRDHHISRYTQTPIETPSKFYLKLQRRHMALRPSYEWPWELCEHKRCDHKTSPCMFDTMTTPISNSCPHDLRVWSWPPLTSEFVTSSKVTPTKHVISLLEGNNHCPRLTLDLQTIMAITAQ